MGVTDLGRTQGGESRSDPADSARDHFIVELVATTLWDCSFRDCATIAAPLGLFVVVTGGAVLADGTVTGLE